MQKLVWQNSNGDVIDLTSGNYGITNWEGFSNADLNIQSQQVPFQDGAVFLDSLIDQRELSVTLAMQDSGNLEERYRMRRELIHALNPKLGEGYLIYTNDFISKRIKCVAQIPLFETHNSNDSGTPKASLAWTACDPYWEDLEEKRVLINKAIRKNIINEGDIPCQMKIELTMANTTNPEIKSFTQNKKISLESTFNTNLLIDTNYGQKKVVAEELNFDKLLSSDTFLAKIIYDKTKATYFAFGQQGRIAYSTDGENWNNKTSESGKSFRDVTYSKKLDLYVAPVQRVTGYLGYMEISKNALDWTGYEIPLQTQPLSVVYSETLEKFVGCGYYEGGAVFSSVDGMDWEVQLMNLNYDSLNSITYSERLGLFVIVGEGGTILTSTDGDNWTQQTSPNNNELVKVVYFDEKRIFIATGSYGTIITSSDGINWESSETEVNYQINDVCYSENLDLFIAVGQGNYYLYSQNGYIWNKTSLLSSGYLSTSICYSEELGLFIAIDRGFNSSSDGIEWKRQEGSYSLLNLSNKYIKYIDAVKMYFIAEGGLLIRSKDGENWTRCEIPNFLEGFRQIIYVEEQKRIYVIGYSVLLYSEDGISWNKVDLPTGQYTTIAYSDIDKYLVISKYDGMYKSTDGENWVQIRNSGFSQIIYNVENNMFIAGGGDYSRIYISYDCENWEKKFEDSRHYVIKSIAYSKNLRKFVAVGGDTQNVGDTQGQSTIVISEDGLNWESLNYNFNKCLLFVEYIDYYGFFIATGERGLLLTSVDGIIWVSRNENILWESFQSIAFSKDLDLFLSVGYDSLLVSSYLTILNNEIDKITKDSDLSLGLNVGNNILMVNCSSGTINAKISYRQKYIGV